MKKKKKTLLNTIHHFVITHGCLYLPTPYLTAKYALRNILQNKNLI